MTLLEKYIKEFHNTEDFKQAVADYITKGLPKKGIMPTEQVRSLIKDAIDWGIKYADSYPNKLN